MTASRSSFYGCLRSPVFIVAITLLIFILSAVAFAQWILPDTTVDIFKNKSFSELEADLGQVQQRFEKGQLTEFQLRNAFRPFYDINEQSAKKLTQWVSSYPNSYAAHLALGIYFRRRGMDARGENFIQDTPQSALDKMNDYYQKAILELRTSMDLTQKPYLSIFHLLTISMQYGDEQMSLDLLHQGNQMLPNNSLVRNRYAMTLLPRWGGSYEAFDEFISYTKAEGVQESIVQQLEAIKNDDQGKTLEKAKRHSEAMEHFKIALDLAARIGGTFAMDYLQDSRYYGCSIPNPPLICR